MQKLYICPDEPKVLLFYILQQLLHVYALYVVRM